MKELNNGFVLPESQQVLKYLILALRWTPWSIEKRLSYFSTHREQSTLAPRKRASCVPFQLRESFTQFTIISKLRFWIANDHIETLCLQLSDPQQIEFCLGDLTDKLSDDLSAALFFLLSGSAGANRMA